jgi:translation initiation factor 4B
MRPDPVAGAQPAGKEASAPTSPAAAPATPVTSNAPASRPKLNLQKRTVSQAEPSPALPTGVSDAKASPFGAARPIDTSAREKEIEEKLRQRKEQEDKAREEKRAADEKSKAEKRQNKEDKKGKPNGQSKDGDNQETVSRNYQILKREAGEEDSEADEGEAATDSVSPDVEKNVKPQEVVRDKNGTSGDATSAEQLQEEGWSTVSKPTKGRRGGNTTSRALAS